MEMAKTVSHGCGKLQSLDFDLMLNDSSGLKLISSMKKIML